MIKSPEGFVIITLFMEMISMFQNFFYNLQNKCKNEIIICFTNITSTSK